MNSSKNKIKERAILYFGGFNFITNNASSIRVIENARFFESLGIKTMVYGKINLDDKETFTPIKGIEVRDIRKTDNDSQNIDFTTNIDRIKIAYNSIKNQYNNIIIITYNYPPIAFSKLIKFSQVNKIVLIPDITEWYGIDGGFTIMKGIRLALNEWRMHFLNKKCKNMIVASSYLEKKYKNSNTLRLPFVTIQKSNFNKKIEIDLNNLSFVYAGSPGKNFSKDRLDIIIKAFAKTKYKHSNFTLNIVGLEKSELLAIKEIKEDVLLLSENIKCFGRVSNDICVSIIKSSNFVIFARDKTRANNAGYPTKVFEAFKYGLPVITNKTSDIDLHVTNENGFMVENATINEFLEVIESILTSKKVILLEKTENCRNYNPFFYKNYKKNTEDFFKNRVL